MRLPSWPRLRLQVCYASSRTTDNVLDASGMILFVIWRCLRWQLSFGADMVGKCLSGAYQCVSRRLHAATSGSGVCCFRRHLYRVHAFSFNIVRPMTFLLQDMYESAATLRPFLTLGPERYTSSSCSIFPCAPVPRLWPHASQLDYLNHAQE